MDSITYACPNFSRSVTIKVAPGEIIFVTQLRNAYTIQQSKCTSMTYLHYIDVIMSAMASQITSLTIVYYSTVYSGTDQRKHQSSASLAFVRGIHRWPVNSRHKRPVTGRMSPFDDDIMLTSHNWTFSPSFFHFRFILLQLFEIGQRRPLVLLYIGEILANQLWDFKTRFENRVVCWDEMEAPVSELVSIVVLKNRQIVSLMSNSFNLGSPNRGYISLFYKLYSWKNTLSKTLIITWPHMVSGQAWI